MKSNAPQSKPLRTVLAVTGMMCGHCEKSVREALEAVPGVAAASVNLGSGRATVTLSSPVGDDALITAVEAAGYKAAPLTLAQRVLAIAGFFVTLSCVIAFGWALRHVFGIDLLAFAHAPDATATLGALFAAGLLTSLHCAGMCGAMVICGSLSARSGDVAPHSRGLWFTALIYNTARIASYAVVGAVVGAAGAVLAPGSVFRGAVQIVAGCVMLLFAARMLGWLPFRLPQLSFAPRIPLLSIHHPSLRAAVLGLATGLMPCGPLQTMQLWALASGGAARGAAAMLAFGLGTTPTLFAVGAAAGFFSRRRAVFGRIAAAIMIALALGMARRGIRAWSADPNAITYDCCERPEVPTAPETSGPASPYLDLAPGADGFVAVPLSRITDTALYVNVPAADASLPAVQLIAVRDGTGRARIAFNTCQACNPSPRAWFAQRGDGSLVCQNCGNDFGREAVGARVGGCNPAFIPGIRETPDALLVPAAALDAARPAFANWAGPRKLDRQD